MPVMIRDNGLGTSIAEEFLGKLVKFPRGKAKNSKKRRQTRSR